LLQAISEKDIHLRWDARAGLTHGHGRGGGTGACTGDPSGQHQCAYDPALARAPQYRMINLKHIHLDRKTGRALRVAEGLQKAFMLGSGCYRCGHFSTAAIGCLECGAWSYNKLPGGIATQRKI